MFNKVILIGRLVADPELKQTPNGIPVCAFRIAVNRRYAGKDKERQTDFFDIVAWRTQGEFVSRYFSKGKAILVEGVLQSRSYEDKNGQRRTVVEVVADNLQFAESKNAGAGSTGSDYSRAPASGASAYRSPGAPPPNTYASGEAEDFSQASLDAEDFPF